MATRIELSRRAFLKAGVATGGGLLIGFVLPGFAQNALAAAAGADAAAAFKPNAWIHIAPDETVTLEVGSSEMGQGVMTAIPMLIAEELDADWSRVRAEFAPADQAYANPLFGRQVTGGSTTVRGFWRVCREAGAVGREMLVAAAAKAWGVKPDACRTEAGYVIHSDSGQRRSYGQLAALAAAQPVPSAVFLKEPDEFRLLGHPRARLDTPAKVDGSAGFGLDVRLPGLLTAVVVRCPVFGGKVKHFKADKAKRIKGVRHVLAIDSGVAVVAEHFWAAEQGAKALEVSWDEGQLARLDDAGIRRQFRAAIDKGISARHTGDAAAALKQATQTGNGRVIEAEYTVPYLAHACMEPMNCTVRIDANGCDIWAPTQNQSGTQQVGMKITGLPQHKVRVHTTFLGGGFGRRSETDFVIEAVQLAHRLRQPVKVVWTREDDTRHDVYRPATYNRLSAALGADGKPVAWRHRIAGPSILSRVFPNAVKNGLDNSSVEGAANLPYAIPNIEVSYAMVNPGVPVGFWRSVGSSQNAYITECFLDELAHAGGQDPYALRRALLADKPRHLRVLELAADKAGWGKTPAAGRARGIAVAESFGSVCAQVAEVSVEQGAVRVHRVVCAIDCGATVNPAIVEAQMESGIVYGLTAALMGEINIEHGRVKQGNFNDYPTLRIGAMPAIEVHIVKTDAAPGGVGEPGTPPIAPAVANAVFAATGKPVRHLPIRLGS